MLDRRRFCKLSPLLFKSFLSLRIFRSLERILDNAYADISLYIIPQYFEEQLEDWCLLEPAALSPTVFIYTLSIIYSWKASISSFCLLLWVNWDNAQSSHSQSFCSEILKVWENSSVSEMNPLGAWRCNLSINDLTLFYFFHVHSCDYLEVLLLLIGKDDW